MRLFFDALGNVLLLSSRHVGFTWAFRIVYLLHALPYFAGAYLFGWAAIWLWGAEDLMSRNAGGWLCAGGVMFFTAIDWFRQWRRGRRD